MSQDYRYAIRTLLKNPAFTLIAVFALALGIGANTAIFTVADRVLLRPLPYRGADRLVNIVRKFQNGSSGSMSIPKFAAIRKTRLLEAVSIYDFMGPGMNLGGGGAPEQVRGVHVSAEYFRLFGVAPALGRTFTPEEDRPAGPRVAVLSNGLWKRRFGGDAGMVGRAVRLNSEPFTVVGVMGPEFAGEPETDLFLPAQADLNSANQGHFLSLSGRLKPGVTLAQANAELRAVADRFRQTYPGVISPQEVFAAQPMTPVSVFDTDLRTPLLVLMGAVAFVLLIACANVANLLLARAAGRSKEIAIRMAIGAGRGAIVRQLLTESLLLALAGGAIGLFLGAFGLRALLAVAPAELPRLPAAAQLSVFSLLDGRILAFALGLAILTGVLFGLAPALQISRPNLNASLREGGARTTAGSLRQRTRSALVVAEIALSLVLLAGAALMARTFLALRGVQPGFQTSSVLTMSSSLAGKKYETAAGVELLATEYTRRLEALPGVQAATYALVLPLQIGPDLPFSISGKPPADGSPFNGDEQYRPVGAHYFQTLGIPLRRGRLFDERDSSSGPWTLVVNEALAKKYWPKENAVGAVVTIGRGLGPEFNDRPREVVGVVADVHEYGIDRNPPPVMYIPVGQEPDGFVALANRVLPSSWAVRAAGDPATQARAVQQAALRVDPDLPMARIMTMDRVLAQSMARQDFNMILLSVFGGVALLLAAIGIYGVMSYTVEQRTNEFGIRMALGAGAGQLLRLVVGHGLALAGIGVAIGLAASFGLTRLMSSLLYGVKATDLASFAGVAAVLSAVAAIACYIPARRATRVDPVLALRRE
ncbi:MAG: ABC transporter permease [Acidobacteriia bacterium]|nr:ABC transporter permease [Terriglobia bacterium]